MGKALRGEDSQPDPEQETELMLQWWKFASPQFFSRIILQARAEQLVRVQSREVVCGEVEALAKLWPIKPQLSFNL